MRKSIIKILAACAVLSSAANAGTVRVPFVLAAGAASTQVYSFGEVGVGQYVYATFTYKNNSAKPLTITGKSNEGAAELTDTDCPTTLEPQASCNVVVGMNVSNLGAASGAVKFTTDQYTNSDIFAVSATGISPGSVLSVAPSSASFSYNGDEKTFTISNPRVYPVRIDSVASSTAYWGVTSNNCGGELAAGATCQVKAKYTSTRAGAYSATLKVVSQSVTLASSNLTGSLQYGAPSMSQGNINASPLLVGQPYTSSIVLTNTGTGPLFVTDVLFETSSDVLSFTSNACTGNTLLSGQSCIVGIKVLFQTAGAVQTNLAFKLTNSSNAYATVGLFASAQAATSVLTLSPTSVNFGGVLPNAASSVKQVTLASTGNAPVTVSDLKITGTNASNFSIQNKASCIGALSAGNQCVLNLIYTGSTVAATHSANLSATSTSSVTPAIVSLTGSTVVPQLTISPSSDTITGTTGQTYYKDFAVTNSGTVPTTITAVTSSLPAYTLTGSTCVAGATLQPLGSCAVRATLSPVTAASSGTTQISVAYGANGAYKATASLTHTITAPKVLPILSDITCPTISAAYVPNQVVGTDGYCSMTIQNPGASTIFIKNTDFVKDNTSNTSFNLVGSVVKINGTDFGFSVGPNGLIRVSFRYEVPVQAGSVSANYTISTYSKIGDPSTATTFTRPATVNVVAPDITLSNVTCPTSVYTYQPITCTAVATNKSLSKYSTFYSGTNILSNYQQLAAKFSEVLVSGVAASTKLAPAPAVDSKPAINFNWNVSTSVPCTGNGVTVAQLVPGSSCVLSITFNPTVPGTYNIPLYAVGSNAWLKASNNATFEVKDAQVDLVATPFVCTPTYVGNTGTCTTTLKNTTVSGVSKYFVPPTASVSGAGANLVLKTSSVPKVTHTCGYQIAPGASCTYSLNFYSTTPGDFPTDVTLTSGGQSDVVSMPIKVLPPDIAFSAFTCPATVADNDLATCTATLTNKMTTPVTVSKLAVVGPGFATPTIANYGTIAAGQSATVSMSFRSATAGVYTGAVTATFYQYGDFKSTAALTVNTVPAASGVLSPFTCPVLNFGQTGNCTATLTNQSSQRSLSVTSIYKPYNTAFGNLTHTCGTLLAPGANCTITVPVVSSVPGTFSTTVTAATSPVQTQPVNATINSLIFSAVADAPLKTAVGTAVNYNVTFKNENTTSVTIPSTAISYLGTGYSIITNNCSNKTLAPQQACSVVVKFLSYTGGVFTGGAKLTYGGANAVGNLSTTVVVPKITVEPAYPAVTTDVGFRALSGNWYKVTNDSPNSITLAKIVTSYNVVVFSDSAVSGSCYVGKVLDANASCLILEQNNLTTLTSAPTIVYNTGVISATSGLSGSWSSKYNTYGAALKFDQNLFTGMKDVVFTGSVTFTNNNFVPVSGLSFSRNSKSTTTGVLSFTGTGCSGEIPAGGSCVKTFEYTGSAMGSSSLYVDVTGKYQRVVSGQPQGWGENAVIASTATAASVYITVPTGTVTPGAYDAKTPNWTSSNAISTFKNTSKFAYNVTNLTFTGGTDQSLVSTDCIGVTLAPDQTCSVTTKWAPWINRTESQWNPGTITVTVTGGYQFTGLVRVFRLPWAGGPEDGNSGQTTGPVQLKTCTFYQTSPALSADFNGCNLDSTPWPSSKAICSTMDGPSWWIERKLFNGFVSATKVVGTDSWTYKAYPYNGYADMTWKNSGMPVTPIKILLPGTSSQYVNYGILPSVQVRMANGTWTRLWNFYSSNSLAGWKGVAVIQKAGRLYTGGWGVRPGDSFISPHTFGGGIDGMGTTWTWSGSEPYLDLVSYANIAPYSAGYSLGTAARVVWQENTPGTGCHMPGTIRVE